MNPGPDMQYYMFSSEYSREGLFPKQRSFGVLSMKFRIRILAPEPPRLSPAVPAPKPRVFENVYVQCTKKVRVSWEVFQ